MGLLNINSTPAERACRCSFAENFRDNRSVVENGGTITGGPQIDDGVTLDGSTQYITYALDGHEFNSANISIVVEFYPDFDYDNNQDSYIIDTTSSKRYLILKRNNAASNNLAIQLGGTTIANIPAGTYSPYWLVGQRNSLLISGASGSTNAWLNGTQILTNDTTAWAKKAPTALYIGSSNVGGSLFDGKITSFKVFNSLLDAQDAAAYYNNTLYDYRKRAVIDLPMDAARHDPTNTRTLDVSGYGNHVVFGDGATSTTYPTKLSSVGYSCDGGDYFLVSDKESLRPGTNDFTIACLIKRGPIAGGDAFFSKGDTGSGEFMFGWSALKPEIRFYGDGGSFNETWNAGVNCFWEGIFRTVAYVRRSDTGIIYVDGVAVDINTGVGSINLDSVKDICVCGREEGTTGLYEGDILKVLYAPSYGLSSIQIADLHLRMMRSVNNV